MRNDFLFWYNHELIITQRKKAEEIKDLKGNSTRLEKAKELKELGRVQFFQL